MSLGSRLLYGDDWRLEWPDDDDLYEVVGNLWMPKWVEMMLFGFDRPDMFTRVELRDGVPRLVRLEYSSGRHQTEIRARDLRSMEVDGFVAVLYAGLARHGGPCGPNGMGVGDDGDNSPEFIAVQRFINNHRRPEGKNDVTPEFLESVAKVYSANEATGAPTQAVARTFGVKARMAAYYAAQCREAGLLPEKTPGRTRK